MKMGYVFKVWLLSNLLHPLFFAAAEFTSTGHLDMDWSEMIGPGFMLFFFSMILSLPSLIGGWILIWFVLKFRSDEQTLFFLWLFLIPLVAVLNWVLPLLLVENDLSFEVLSLSLPSAAAVFLSVILLYKSFFNLFKSPEPEELEFANTASN